MKHGAWRYSNGYCNCDVCRQAWATYCDDQRAQRAERLREDPSLAPHGSSSTYDNWRCRCGPCCEARAAYKRARRRAVA